MYHSNHVCMCVSIAGVREEVRWCGRAAGDCGQEQRNTAVTIAVAGRGGEARAPAARGPEVGEHSAHVTVERLIHCTVGEIY